MVSKRQQWLPRVINGQQASTRDNKDNLRAKRGKEGQQEATKVN